MCRLLQNCCQIGTVLVIDHKYSAVYVFCATCFVDVSDVSGGCLENLVSFMYSGVLHLTRDTVNSVMLVATQMEMSTAVELCQNFIANPPCSASPPCSADPPCSVDPPCSDPFGEKENSDCNSKDVTEDDEVDEVVYTKEPPVNLKKEKTIDTRSPISLRKRVRVGSRSSPSRMARSSPSTMTSTYNKCGWCGQKFTARSMLVEHRNNVHRKRTDAALVPVCRRVIRDWTCSEKDCAMQFKHKDKLCQHMAEHHPTVIFSCPECRFKTQVEHILKRYHSHFVCCCASVTVAAKQYVSYSLVCDTQHQMLSFMSIMFLSEFCGNQLKTVTCIGKCVCATVTVCQFVDHSH